MRILVADDDTSIRALLREVFSPPHTVIEVGTAIAAKEALSRHPDFAIIDNRMPMIVGARPEAVGLALLGDASIHGVPAILFTGDEDAYQAAMRLGFRALMKGPDSKLMERLLDMLPSGVEG